jgi:hypothetical protein
MGAKAQIEEMRNNLGKQRGTLKSDYNNIDTQFKEQLIKTKASRAVPSADCAGTTGPSADELGSGVRQQ